MAFLVFEGLDGAGKSTLIESLAQELKKNGREFIRTREPGGTPLAEEIRALLLRTKGDAPVPRAELLLYAAGRAQHVDRVIAPALTQGKWVLCDRFTASSVAFQCFARGLERSHVDQLNTFAVDGVAPSLNILLDLPVEESLARIGKRSEGGQEPDRFERERSDFHERVRTGYLTQAKAKPEKWLVLDACRPAAELFVELKNALQQRGHLGIK